MKCITPDRMNNIKLFTIGLAVAALMLLAPKCFAQTNVGAVPRSYPTYNSADPFGFTAIRGLTNDAAAAQISLAALRAADSNLTALVEAASNALVAAYAAADTTVSNAFVAADTQLRLANTATSNAFINADQTIANSAAVALATATNLYGYVNIREAAVTNSFNDRFDAEISARGAADTVVSNAFVSADTAISNTFTSADALLSGRLLSLSNAFNVATGSEADARDALSNLLAQAISDGDLTVSNAFINADITLAGSISALALSVAALPSTAYVDSQDALDRAYAYSLFESATSTTNNTVVRFLDRYDSANSWLEYGSGVVTRVSVVALPLTNYQWFAYANLALSTGGRGGYNASVHPTINTELWGAFLTNTVAGATNFAFGASAGFYELSAAASDTVVGIASDGSYITPAFRKYSSAYSFPGDMNGSASYSSPSALLSGTTPNAGKITPPSAAYTFSSFQGESYTSAGNPTYAILNGTTAVSIYLFRRDTITAGQTTTNRTDILAFTNGVWTAIGGKVSTNDFITATNALTQAVNSKVSTSTFTAATNTLTQAVAAAATNLLPAIASASQAGTNYTDAVAGTKVDINDGVATNMTVLTAIKAERYDFVTGVTVSTGATHVKQVHVLDADGDTVTLELKGGILTVTP